MLPVVSLRCLEISFLFQDDLQPGKRKKLKGAKSSEQGRWRTTGLLCLAKNSLIFLATGHCVSLMYRSKILKDHVWGNFWMNSTLKGLQYGSVNSLTL